MNIRNCSQTKRSILVEQIIQEFFKINHNEPLAKEVLREMKQDINAWITSINVSWTEFKFSQLGEYCLTMDV